MSRVRRAVAPTGTAFFAIRLSSITPDVPLLYEIFVGSDREPVRFLARGAVLSHDRLIALARRRGLTYLVPEEHRGLYLESLRAGVVNPETETGLRSQFIKESAFLHVHDLFTRNEVGMAIGDAKSIVEEMVKFVSSDVETAANLMRLSSHDYYTYNHCVNVGIYSIALARRIFGDDKNALMAAGLGGLLHDLGKRRIDWNVINKSGPLTRAEWEEIKRHPAYGKEALEGIGSVPDGTLQVVYQHHENFNGKGYPQGLRGDEISLLSRIVAIADVFDALTTDRSYHRAMVPADALTRMFRMQPGKFDASVFKLFTKNFEGVPLVELPDDFDACDIRSVARAFGKR